jgi:hypothetical protein
VKCKTGAKSQGDKKSFIEPQREYKNTTPERVSQEVSHLNHFAGGRPLGHELTTTYSGAYSASLSEQ